MAIPEREQRILQQKSGNRCAFPTCRRLLTAEGSTLDRAVLLGEMAHIVAESPDGPRGNSPMTLKERNRADNLILLCNVHHQQVDDQPQTYTVERLLQMKRDHEAWVEATLGRGVDDAASQIYPPQQDEVLYSSLLPVERMPRFVYGAPCALTDVQAIRAHLRPMQNEILAPFLLRAGQLFAFQDLRAPDNPFADIIDPPHAVRYRSPDWWNDSTRQGWFISLTNLALNKITGRRGLRYDKHHRRYYFTPTVKGQDKTVRYQSINKRAVPRKVVWEPKNKKTGEGRGYWLHRAVALRFLQINTEQWCLTVRPELHVSLDGEQPYPSEKIGSRVTRKKSRMFNYDLLTEIHFWRDYLSSSRPHIVLRFDEQQLIIVSTSLAQGKVTWPGIPSEHAKAFTNVEFVDDLFSWAERQAPDQEDKDDDWHDDDDNLVDEDLFGE